MSCEAGGVLLRIIESMESQWSGLRLSFWAQNSHLLREEARHESLTGYLNQGRFAFVGYSVPTVVRLCQVWKGCLFRRSETSN